MNFITALKAAHEQIRKDDKEMPPKAWPLLKRVFGSLLGLCASSAVLMTVLIFSGSILASGPAAPAVILFISATVGAFGLAALTCTAVYYAVRGSIHGIESLVLAKKMMHDDNNPSNNQTNSTANVQSINIVIDNSLSKDIIKTLKSNRLVSDSSKSTNLNVTYDDFLKAIELDKHAHPTHSNKNKHPEKLFARQTVQQENVEKNPEKVGVSKLNSRS